MRPPEPELVDGEEEWEVEEVLDSRLLRGKLKYLVKWKGFGREDNSWEAAADVHAAELIQEFYERNPGATRLIRALQFGSIPFRSISDLAPGRCNLEGGIDVRGTPKTDPRAHPPGPAVAEVAPPACLPPPICSPTSSAFSPALSSPEVRTTREAHRCDRTDHAINNRTHPQTSHVTTTRPASKADLSLNWRLRT